MYEHYKNGSESRNVSGAKTGGGCTKINYLSLCMCEMVVCGFNIRYNAITFSFGVMYSICEGDMVNLIVFHSHAL